MFRGCFAECVFHQEGDHDFKNITTNSPKISLRDQIYHIENKEQCLEKGFDWVKDSYNFDSLPNALISLFVFSTLDGWADMTRRGSQCIGEDLQPKAEQYTITSYVYFISFLLTTCFFVSLT